MRIEAISIRNFRLLRRISMQMSAHGAATVLVGPNNSGKTSIMAGLRLFLGTEKGDASLSFYDFSQKSRNALHNLSFKLADLPDGESRISTLRRSAPRMRMDVLISYDEVTPDIVAATPFLMNLSPTDSRIVVRSEYALEDARQMLKAFDERPRKLDSFYDFLRSNLPQFYKRQLYKVSLDRSEVIAVDGPELLRNLIKVDTISAQRHIDDADEERSVKISRLLHHHYTRFYKVSDSAGHQSVEDALVENTKELTKRYEAAFVRLKSRLKDFGYPSGHNSPDLRIRAEMSSETLYRDNARVYYGVNQTGMNSDHFELPERYNGLGFKNLIFIVLQLESFRAVLEAKLDEQPRMHVVCIEEPEAHLHPQMQWVFVDEIMKAAGGAPGAPAQIIISTHSSHMIANSGFEPIRYFRSNGSEVVVRDLSTLPLPSDGEDVLNFLRRYIRLTHCDLFFADKAIFVEGQVERLLMPLMIKRCAESRAFKAFGSQYISILEVGGAYAHRFRTLIDFLGIPTLIITDIDALGVDGKKCRVAGGLTTSNACLRTWIPKESDLSKLMICNSAQKVSGCIRVAYQTPEDGDCGRSFEEAFIYGNLCWLIDKRDKLLGTAASFGVAGVAELQQAAWKISGDIAKVDFALDLIAVPGWKTPAYIQEGLEWLATTGNA